MTDADQNQTDTDNRFEVLGFIGNRRKLARHVAVS